MTASSVTLSPPSSRPLGSDRWIALVILLGLFAFSPVASHGVILFRTADVTANTTVPTNDPAGSGWNYEGQFGGFLATAIAPHFIITAKHIGIAPLFTYAGIHYHVVGYFPDPASDLAIFQIQETLPTYAPLYSGLGEVGQRIVAIGRGTQRGAEYILNGNLRGWLWGPGDGVTRWGENVVGSIVPYGTDNELLRAPFDQNGLSDECHLSSGDSGGAAFLNDNGTWKLAGIHFAVDDFYSDENGGGKFTGALFDIRGLWTPNDAPPPAYVQFSGPEPVPSGFYPTRISRRLPWICSVVAAPVMGREGNFLTLTYTKLAVTPDITYVVEQSTDLNTWGPAATTDEVLPSSGSAQTIKAKVDVTGIPVLFLRLRTTRP